MPPAMRRKRARPPLPSSLPTDRTAAWEGGQCGACLLELLEDADADVDEGVGVIEVCSHVFHPQCLTKWAARDTSCPLCRLSFEHIAIYSRAGEIMGPVRKVEPQAFADTLTSEEEEEGSEEEDEPGANDQEGSTHVVTVAPSTSLRDDTVAAQAAAERLRVRLRRQHEIRRRRRNAVPAGQAKRTIERYFRRLPFNPELPKEGSKAASAAVPVKFVVGKATQGTNFSNFRQAKPADA